MTESRVAKRYAEAIFRAAQDRRAVDEIGGELIDLSHAIEAVPEARAMIKHPEVPPERSLEILNRVFSGELEPETMGLLRLLVERGRLEELENVIGIYRQLADEAARIHRGEVRSVIPLSEAQMARLQAALSRHTGGTVTLESRLDPSLLAGIWVRIGDYVLDASAAGRLETLRQTLMEVRGEGL
jgi:F-type H+-transporting ATPase subunit delta